MMTTPRWNHAGDIRDDRRSDDPFAHNRTHWSSARAISPRRVDEIRRRLRSGAYDTPQMLDALARRLVDGGEL